MWWTAPLCDIEGHWHHTTTKNHQMVKTIRQNCSENYLPLCDNLLPNSKPSYIFKHDLSIQTHFRGSVPAYTCSEKLTYSFHFHQYSSFLLQQILCFKFSCHLTLKQLMRVTHEKRAAETEHCLHFKQPLTHRRQTSANPRWDRAGTGEICVCAY